MLPRRPGLLLGLLAPLLAAAPSCNGTGTPVGGNFAPFRSGWELVGTFDFPYLDSEGVVQITSVLIGGTESNDNFANRGDIVVLQNGPPDKITVEMRKFTFAESEADAEDDFAKLFPWIYASTSPKQPAEMNPDTNCLGATGWQQGCNIRVWYDGQIQPKRLGADIRVTLPANYRQDVFVTTEDNTIEDAYQDRGNVCVENANASYDIELVSGRAYVIAAPDLTPGPTCSAAEIEACETYTDADDNPAAWAPDCPCQAFGQIAIESKFAGASNGTVDIPGTLWSSMNLDNTSGDPSECTANIDFANAVIEETTSDLPHKSIGEINHPSDAAIAGGGFNIRIASEECGPVRFTEDPADYPGEDNEDDQESEQRGNSHVCDGCIRDQTCDQLLPWIK